MTAATPIPPLDDALGALRRAYQQHVERLAEKLKPRLLAGAFSGWTRKEKMRWDKLEAICRAEPRPWGEEPFLAFALASSSARERAPLAYDDDSPEGRAAFVIAWDVRELAEKRWAAPTDDVWRDQP